MTGTDFARRLWNRCKTRATVYHRTLSQEFTLSTDYFFGIEFLMAVGGVWLNSKNAKLRRCWNLYRWFICLPITVVCWNTVLNVIHRERLETVLSSVQAAVANVTIMSRAALILWYYEPLMEVRQFVNRRHFGRNLQTSLDNRSKAFYHIRKLVTRVIAFMLVLGTSIHALDISSHHFLKLPFDVRASLPIVDLVCVEFIKLSLIGWAMTAALVFLVVYTILTGLSTETEVIAQTFSTVLDNTEQRVQIRLESKPGNSHQHTYMQKYYFWKHVQEEFSDCVELNIKFLTEKTKIAPLLNATFLLIYYSTAVVLANGAIYLSQMNTITLFSLQTLSYCLWIAFECALLTRMVNLLAEANESIGWQVYSLDWPLKFQYDRLFRRQYRSVCEMMTTVVVVSQQPLRLNCFGLFEFTQDRFWELLNMAYNLYTFMRDFF